MTSVVAKCRLLYKPVSSVLQRNEQVYRLTRLTPVRQYLRNFCSVPIQFDLSIDKSTLSKHVEDMWKDCRLHDDEEMDSLFEKREQIIKNISSLNIFDEGSADDKEFKKLLEEEGQQYSDELDRLNLQILHHSYLKVHSADFNSNSAVLEVAAGVGGQEAMLFAADLFRMYELYAASKGWEVEPIEVAASDLGGIRSSVVCVRGPEVYKMLRCEGGVHRIQRVPQTERSGRLHTSTATVVVMPEPSEIDVNIEEKDLRIETKRPSGPGGQNAQKTDSAVRITHMPSGIVCSSQEHRTPTKNIKVAMRHLRAKLYALNYGKREASVEAARRQQEGTRMRSEKIRTYNVPQDRVTDHRWGVTVHNLPELWSAGQTLYNLMQTCGQNYEQQLFTEFLRNIKSVQRRSAGGREH